MKSRITITLDPEVIRHGKRVARSRETSLSGLIEDLLTEQDRPGRDRLNESFSRRWRGRHTLRENARDDLLQALKARHVLGRS